MKINKDKTQWNYRKQQNKIMIKYKMKQKYYKSL